MPVTYPSTPTLASGTPYHHVALGTGTTIIYVAGQVAHVNEASDFPTGLANQVAQTLRNVAAGLTTAGAGFSDVLRLTFYVVDWDTNHMTEFMAGVEAVAPEIELPLPMPPASLIGVAQLFEPGVLVEVEATAVI